MQIRRYNISVLENETCGNIEPAPAPTAAPALAVEGATWRQRIAAAPGLAPLRDASQSPGVPPP